jgi:hypothetical protein
MTDEYRVGHLEQALAERVSELGLHVVVVADQVYVRGTVSTPERRDAVTAVLAELVPELGVHNEIVVCGFTEPTEAEALS